MNVVKCQDGIPPDVGVPMFQVLDYGGYERFQDLRLLKLAEKPESRASDVFVGMVDVVTDGISIGEENWRDCYNKQTTYTAKMISGFSLPSSSFMSNTSQ